MHELLAGRFRSADGVADADEAGGLAATVQWLLALLVHQACPVWVRSST